MFYSDSLTRVCSEKEKIVSRKFFFRRSLANKYKILLLSVSRKNANLRDIRIAKMLRKNANISRRNPEFREIQNGCENSSKKTKYSFNTHG